MSQVMNRSQTSVQKKTIRLVVFAIAGYQLGLPLDQILRVVNCPDELRSQTSAVVKFSPSGQHTISVLNLRSQLSLEQIYHQTEGDFLIVAKVGEELYAIRVDAPPDLIEVDAAMIRQLPAAYRQGHPLRIASHVVVLPQGKATLAIFLLELNRVLAAIQTSD